MFLLIILNYLSRAEVVEVGNDTEEIDEEVAQLTRSLYEIQPIHQDEKLECFMPKLFTDWRKDNPSLGDNNLGNITVPYLRMTYSLGQETNCYLYLQGVPNKSPFTRWAKLGFF